MIGFANFKRDPNYLLKNNLWRIAALALVNAGLCLLFPPSITTLLAFAVPIFLLSTAGTLTTSIGLLTGIGLCWFQQGFSPMNVFWFAAALFITFPVTALYHSCTHQSLRPRFLNRFLGELCGLIHTSNLDEWSIIHAYHHRYADDVENDPHAPEGQGFFKFASTTGKAIGKSFARHYIQAHGQTPNRLTSLKWMSRAIVVRQIALTLFWYFLLPTDVFVFFFATNVVSKKVHYAWFNWATHVKTGDVVEVTNKNHGLYFFINLISFNLYFHKNHHLRPGLFNPKSLKQNTSGTVATEEAA